MSEVYMAFYYFLYGYQVASTSFFCFLGKTTLFALNYYSTLSRWGSCRAHLIFHFSEVTVPQWLMLRILKSSFHIFGLFLFISDGRVSPIPAIPSGPESWVSHSVGFFFFAVISFQQIQIRRYPIHIQIPAFSWRIYRFVKARCIFHTARIDSGKPHFPSLWGRWSLVPLHGACFTCWSELLNPCKPG